MSSEAVVAGMAVAVPVNEFVQLQEMVKQLQGSVTLRDILISTAHVVDAANELVRAVKA